MTPEEKEKLKEAEKAHLRKLKELKEMARGATRTASVNKALQEMTSWGDKLSDTYNEMMEKIAMASARNEARIDLAMESTETSRAEEMAHREEVEEEARKLRAQQLLAQMKAERDVPAPSQERTVGPRQTEPEPPAEQTPMPEKTIGRMK